VRIHKTSQAFPNCLSLPCGVGFQNFERANALLKNIPQLAVAFWERISHQCRTQRINVEQLELANIPLKIAKALSGDAIAHLPHPRRLYYFKGPIVQALASFHKRKDRQRKRLPAVRLLGNELLDGREAWKS